MDIGGGYILTADQAAAWQQAYPDEYAEYVEAGLFDPDTNELLDIPPWMDDGDPTNGPFDFSLNPSHGNSGW
ncbi:MAG: hypothetical protein IKF90_02555 [Parasporobacterium sp.]|nr:hypothetical protein [Parasporobacterium sp.]